MRQFQAKLRVTLIILSIPFLSGCGVYNRGFQCPPGEGVGCVPTTEVLDMIEEKEPETKNPFDSGHNLFNPQKRADQ